MCNNEFITNFNVLKNMKCQISYDFFSLPDTNGYNVIKLKCGHIFKFNYLYYSSLVQNDNLWGYKKCPYCMKNYGKLPFKIKKSNIIKKNIFKHVKL